MKKLNRKEYKKAIQEFRKVCPLTQIHHKWVFFKDYIGDQHIMFVKETIVKRANNKLGFYNDNSFEFKDYQFFVQFIGCPVISFCLKGNGRTIDEKMYGKNNVTLSRYSLGSLKVLHTLDEARQKLDEMINRFKYFAEFDLKLEDNKEE